MQYLVHVSGEVADKQNKAYIINSASVEDAQILATDAFCDEFAADCNYVYVKPQIRTHKAILSMWFLLVPILLSLINWKNGHDTISISPDYVSCLYGVLFYAAFIVRFKGVHRAVGSWIDILFCMFSVLLLSTFVRTILVSKTFNILGITEIEIDTNVVLPIAIILSWLGLKVVSLMCMAGISVTALFNITALSEAMGTVFGSLYIICAFVGIMLYISVEPAFVEAVQQIKRTAVKGLIYIAGDIEHTKNRVANVRNMVSTRIGAEKGKPESLSNYATNEVNSGNDIIK